MAAAELKPLDLAALARDAAETARVDALRQWAESRHIEMRALARVVLANDAELELARKTMEGVEAQCFISNSVRSQVKLTPEFLVGQPRE